MVVWLTGGSGSGKSRVAAILAGLGAFVIDADKVARQMTEPGQPALAEIIDAFGEDIAPKGRLLRRELGEIVFSEPEKLKILNKITHKYIVREIEGRVRQSAARHIIIDAPLLPESGQSGLYDCVAAVCAPLELRLERIMLRDGISRQDALNRIAAQKSDEEYRAAADIVIENSGSEERLQGAARRFFAQLEGMA